MEVPFFAAKQHMRFSGGTRLSRPHPHVTRDKGHAGVGLAGRKGRAGLDIRQPTTDSH